MIDPEAMRDITKRYSGKIMLPELSDIEKDPGPFDADVAELIRRGIEKHQGAR